MRACVVVIIVFRHVFSLLLGQPDNIHVSYRQNRDPPIFYVTSRPLTACIRVRIAFMGVDCSYKASVVEWLRGMIATRWTKALNLAQLYIRIIQNCCGGGALPDFKGRGQGQVQ